MKAALRLLLAPYRFSVDRLFRMGEVGWAHWFDSPSLYTGGNHLYLYQDNAGTTPVTAVGDTIGLSLDRAYGGRTDGSLIASGATGLTGTATAASYNTSTGAGSVSRAGDASNQSWVSWTGLTTSSIHRIRITNTGATSLDVRIGSVSGTIVASIAAGATSYVHPLTSGGSTSITITATNNSTTATFTVLEFGRVPGTHLIQATGTARPTLSARVNLLLSTGSFAAAAWTRRGTATVGAAAPDGTGELLAGIGALNSDVFQQKAAVTGAAYKPYVEIWPVSTSGTLVFCNPQGLPYGQWNINMALLSTGQWNVITSSHPAVTVVNNYSGNASLAGVMFYASSGAPLSFYARRPDIRTADDAAKNIPAYQRVGATAADHDTEGFPHYALFDGTDDSWASAATVDGSGSDKVTVVAGVTKSAGTTGIIVEHTASATTTNGGFYIASGVIDGRDIGVASRGSVSSTANSGNVYTAPTSGVVAMQGDIAADALSLRVNSSSAATSSGDQGTGNFANATTYVGSRAGTSLRFNGRSYSLVFRFGAMGEADRNRLEQWTKNLMRLP